MANRHAHKKLRAEVRARMAATGETHQQALTRIQARRPSVSAPGMDLVGFSYFGIPATLATLEMNGFTVFAVVPSSRWWGHGYPHPFPFPLVRALMLPRGST
jgi:hypothetical protein